MSTKNNVNIIPASTLTPTFFKKAGINLKFTPESAKNARAILEQNGATLCKDERADDVYVIAADALKSATTMDEYKKRAAIELAALDMSGVAKTLPSPDGKNYTSTHALFKDILPRLSDSTISNLLGVGRDMFVPALNGTYSDNPALNKAISNLTPSNALIVKGALKDDKTAERVKKSLIESKGELTANEARTIVRNAKQAAGVDKKSRDEANTRKKVSTEDSASDTMCATLKKYVVASLTDNELDIHVNENDLRTFKQFLKDNSADAAKAQVAMKALYKLVSMAR